MKQRTVTATEDGGQFWKFKKGEKYSVTKVYFYNGEHWYRLANSNGFLFNAPACFFKETAKEAL